jgi:hypothetical protein
MFSLETMSVGILKTLPGIFYVIIEKNLFLHPDLLPSSLTGIILESSILSHREYH